MAAGWPVPSTSCRRLRSKLGTALACALLPLLLSSACFRSGFQEAGSDLAPARDTAVADSAAAPDAQSGDRAPAPDREPVDATAADTSPADGAVQADTGSGWDASTTSDGPPADDAAPLRDGASVSEAGQIVDAVAVHEVGLAEAAYRDIMVAPLDGAAGERLHPFEAGLDLDALLRDRLLRDVLSVDRSPAPDIVIVDTIDAIDDQFRTLAGAQLTIPAPGVLYNDLLAAALPQDTPLIAAVLVDPADQGSVQLQADGSFVYAPPQSFTGVDRFTYLVSDGQWDSVPAAVSITVFQGSNSTPSARDDGYRCSTEAVLDVSAPGVLGNDTDADGDRLRAWIETPPDRGSLHLGEDGRLLYIPLPQAYTTAFTYVALDGMLFSGAATVTIDVY